MMKHLLYTLLIYVFLTAVTTAVMQDFSFRHTLFLLADAILLVAGGNLFKEKKWYYKAIAFIMAVLCSVFVIRYYSSATLKVWDVDTYLTFCLALGNILLVTVSLFPVPGRLKNVVLWATALFVFLPVLLLWGYYFTESSWLKEMKQDKNLLLFRNAYSCHSQTVPTLSYALTAKNQYNSLDLKEAVSLIDVANAAGYQTVWLSNQMRYGLWDTPVTVIAGAAGQQIWINSHIGKSPASPPADYHDGELVRRLQDVRLSDKMLIIIRLMGNHIAYHKRYPAEFSKFKGDGVRSEYDNSILYNDYVMKELMKKISTWQNFKGLVYISDHSEAIAHDLNRFMTMYGKRKIKEDADSKQTGGQKAK